MVKPKVLFVSPRFPFPLLRGDQLTVFKMCDYFSQHWDIDLLTFENPAKEAYLSKIPVKNIRILQNTLFDKLLAGIFFVLGTSLQKNFFASILKKSAVQNILETEQYDLIYVHTTRALHLIPEKFRPQTTCGVQISISLQNYRHFKREKGLKRLFYKIESARFRDYETKQLKNIPISFVITEDDRKWLNIPEEKSYLLPHGVDVDKFKRSGPYPTEFDRNFNIIFSGNLDFGPNLLAINRLVNVFHQIREEIPHATLSLIGKCTNKDLIKKLNNNPNIEMTGFVESFTPYFDKASLMINPLTVGSGLQNKVLESLSFGVPVICTKLANNGIKAPESCCIEADSDEDIIRACIDFYKKPEKALQMTQEAEKFVKTQFTWEYFLDKQKDILEEQLLSTEKIS
jgi:glycosyltransferase involved in cell wall biosynthesis